MAETGRDWLESLEIVRTAFKESDVLLERKADHTPPLPAVEQALKALATAKIKLGILSADITANVRDWAERYELESYFQLCLGTESPDLAKPNPALFQQACCDLNVSPASTLMIGDTRGDLAMARAANAAGGVGVSWGWTAPETLREADVVIQHLDQIQVVP
ncbi:MAG: HAD-IA family hydrolase [Cyanobacteria bacterium P01_F01_bin.3]